MLVAFVIETQRSIAVCAPDGSDFTQWLAVDASDPLDTMSAVAIAPDASRIAVGTARGTIHIFRRPTSAAQSSAPALT